MGLPGYQRISSEMEKVGAWDALWKHLDLNQSESVAFDEFLPLCVDHDYVFSEEASRDLYALYSSSATGKVSIGTLQKILKEKTLTAKKVSGHTVVELKSEVLQ